MLGVMDVHLVDDWCEAICVTDFERGHGDDVVTDELPCSINNI